MNAPTCSSSVQTTPTDAAAASTSFYTEPSTEVLPNLVPCRPRQAIAIADYAVHRVVPRQKHPLYRRGHSGLCVNPTPATTGTANTPPREASQAAQSGRVPPPRAPMHIRDGTWRTLLDRDECVARESIELEEIYAAVAALPFPSPWHTADDTRIVHPAVARGASLLARLETYERRTIEEDYTDVFRQRSFRDAQLRARLVATDFRPVEVHLRRWIACRRARRIAFSLRIEKLVRQEAQQREEWLTTSDLAQERNDLLRGVLSAVEALYRIELDRLYLTAAYATAVIGVRLAERADALKIFFGGPMRAAKTCGRISGQTVFATLALEESHGRRAIDSAQAAFAARQPFQLQAATLEAVHEPSARRAIEQAYAEATDDRFKFIVTLAAQYTLRDVEQYEAVERQQLYATVPQLFAPPAVMTPTVAAGANSDKVPAQFVGTTMVPDDDDDDEEEEEEEEESLNQDGD